MSSWVNAIEEDGFVVLPSIFDANQLAQMRSEITAGFANNEHSASAVKRRNGTMVAARNVLEWMPSASTVWNVPPILELLRRLLGSDFGLVRALYFDKPPGQSWVLPWHKDSTIAVVDNELASDSFTHPTIKAGVPHVEAPPELLERMLTLRIFLDDVTEENGPLRVQPGSHRSSESVESVTANVQLVLGRAGDVLAMRPLLTHSSGHSKPDSKMNRRTLHLEFAADRQLPDGYDWHRFVAVNE
ncbi:phytanoyl-CoA dioxygenase family protein [bacterium]|nr:phytanoyl-CoA dioxygenase family protein [bacterium]